MAFSLPIQLPVFRDVSSAERPLIDRFCVVRPVEPGQVLLRQAERPERVHFLLAGQACRSRVLHDGRRQILAILLPGDPCDLTACLRHRSNHAVRMLTAGTVAVVSRSVLLDWIETQPGIANALWRSALASEAILSEWFTNVGLRAASERIAHLMCEILTRLQAVGLARDGGFAFPLKQEELGEAVGLSTVHVNRMVQGLRANGLITMSHRFVKVHDIDKLKAFARFEPDYLMPRWSIAAGADGHYVDPTSEHLMGSVDAS